jgi:hypothetical protein
MANGGNHMFDKKQIADKLKTTSKNFVNIAVDKMKKALWGLLKDFLILLGIFAAAVVLLYILFSTSALDFIKKYLGVSNNDPAAAAGVVAMALVIAIAIVISLYRFVTGKLKSELEQYKQK